MLTSTMRCRATSAAAARTSGFAPLFTEPRSWPSTNEPGTNSEHYRGGRRHGRWLAARVEVEGRLECRRRGKHRRQHRCRIGLSGRCFGADQSPVPELPHPGGGAASRSCAPAAHHERHARPRPPPLPADPLHTPPPPPPPPSPPL